LLIFGRQRGYQRGKKKKKTKKQQENGKPIKRRKKGERAYP
jgi:hypothetical protein